MNQKEKAQPSGNAKRSGNDKKFKSPVDQMISETLNPVNSDDDESRLFHIIFNPEANSGERLFFNRRKKDRDMLPCKCCGEYYFVREEQVDDDNLCEDCREGLK